MRRMVALAASVMLALAACGGSEPDPEACKDALRVAFQQGMAGETETERPSECKGISDAELERLATEVVGDVFTEELGESFEEAFETDSTE